MSWFIGSLKSGKREVAVSLLLLWGFITCRHFIWVDIPTHTAQNNGWETLTWASLAWAAAAFGVDFIMKSKGAILPPAPDATRERRKTSPTPTVIE